MPGKKILARSSPQLTICFRDGLFETMTTWDVAAIYRGIASPDGDQRSFAGQTIKHNPAGVYGDVRVQVYGDDGGGGLKPAICIKSALLSNDDKTIKLNPFLCGLKHRPDTLGHWNFEQGGLQG